MRCYDSEVCQLWHRLAPATLVFFTAAGAIYGAPPAIYPYLLSDFRMTEGEVGMLPTIFQIFWGLSTAPSGLLIQKYGPAACLRFGVIGIALVASGYPLASARYHLFILHALYGVFYSAGGLVVQIVLLNTWFERQPGMAVSVMITGFSFSGMLWPLVVSLVAERFGWRWGYSTVTWTLWLCAAPLVFFFTKDGPRCSADCLTPGMFPERLLGRVHGSRRALADARLIA
ncbi:hypothetical protein CYMTET_15667 [Cymbomonas tetramitiformis]|uniref:Major facilitator superfamily (MFS) profile domain-containing protein n=1 Tax=Cymbomonas tetramitiformis TaxID=36881 RepID=A0AAE0GDX2_9CHLO|nr:hypothetical protein CYMTET_15667 [Cymbomonas tetramitiformis]